MFITFVWFGNSRGAKRTAFIMGLLTAAFLAATRVSFLIDAYKLHYYDRATAIVTDYNTSDSYNVWTEISFEYDNNPYTVRMQGHSYWMGLNDEIEILIKPDNPESVVPAKHVNYVIAKIFLFAAGLFGAFFLLYMLNYLICRKREGAQPRAIN